MNTKWQIIFLVMLIIISICGTFITLFIFTSQENLNNLIDTEITNIRAIIKTVEAENSRHYRNRIQTFINYQELPKQEQIIQAFAGHDREELEKLSSPFLQIFRKENPYFSTFSWLTSDNNAFLRVHRPASFGDYIGKMRPDIVDANKNHLPHAGYMVSKTGLQYRLVQPVLYKGKHIGVLQFGLKDSMLLDTVEKTLSLPVGIAIPNKKFSFISHSKLPSFTGHTHTIQAEQIDIFKQDNSSIDWSLGQQQVSLNGKSYIIANAFNLLDYKEEVQGYLFVALDISKLVEKLKSRITFVILLSSTMLLLSFLILYSSYGKLVQKIINLNLALEKNNLNLEAQVEKRTISLQQQKSQLQRYITAINDIGLGLCVINSDYSLHNMNQTLIDKFGNHNNNSCYQVIMEEESPCANCKLQEVIKKEQTANYQITRSDGRIFEIIATPIGNDDGSTCCMNIIRDITAQKEQEEQRLEINQQIEELKRLESLKTMAGAIAHRFNNSMMAVEGNLELMLLTLADDSDAYKMTSETAQAAKGASQIGAMMLTYVGQRQLEIHRSSFVDLVRECVTAKKDLFQAPISLKFNKPDQPLFCSIDRQQIKEVIESILINAVESLENSAGDVEISFGTDSFNSNSFPLPFQDDCLQNGKYAYCQIKDNGHGISLENLPQIFEPFYSTRFVGRGLGLALTVGIMQRHHGAITIESSPETGTTVRVLLPVDHLP